MDVMTLDEAQKLVKAIRSTSFDYGFLPTLGGGVLYHGRSTHNLDLYFIPRQGETDSRGLVRALTKVWGKPRNLQEDEGWSSAPVSTSDSSLPHGDRIPFRAVSEGTLEPQSGGSGGWNIGRVSGPSSSEPQVIRATPQTRNIYASSPNTPAGLPEFYYGDEDGNPIQATPPPAEEFIAPPSPGPIKYHLRFNRVNDVIDIQVL